MAEAVGLQRVETERGELVLRRREVVSGDPIYEIISNGVFLMASTNKYSARQLSFLALDRVHDREEMRVLIGGLGIGYTLQAALENPRVAQVQVVEVEQHIVEWARTHFGQLNGDALSDPRVRVVVANLASFLYEASGPFDAILLDIDNGPTWLVFEENEQVYGRPALERIRSLLEPGGVLGVWAAEPAPEFLQDLERVFAWADQVVVFEKDERGRDVEYYIYLAGNKPS
jgi:spermidine synthase